jgi:hypothetical protein
MNIFATTATATTNNNSSINNNIFTFQRWRKEIEMNNHFLCILLWLLASCTEGRGSVSHNIYFVHN